MATFIDYEVCEDEDYDEHCGYYGEFDVYYSFEDDVYYFIDGEGYYSSVLVPNEDEEYSN